MKLQNSFSFCLVNYIHGFSNVENNNSEKQSKREEKNQRSKRRSRSVSHTDFLVTPKGFEPLSSEPKSDILIHWTTEPSRAKVRQSIKFSEYVVNKILPTRQNIIRGVGYLKKIADLSHIKNYIYEIYFSICVFIYSCFGIEF